MHLLLTGKPGCGKTTLLRRLIQNLGEAAGGFYTEEVRDAQSQRTDFRIVTLDGESGWLARASQGSSKFYVGRYAVELAALEDRAHNLLARIRLSGSQWFGYNHKHARSLSIKQEN